MIAGSAHPGYPDISTNESDIHLIPCRTEARNGSIYFYIYSLSYSFRYKLSIKSVDFIIFINNFKLK